MLPEERLTARGAWSLVIADYAVRLDHHRRDGIIIIHVAILNRKNKFAEQWDVGQANKCARAIQQPCQSLLIEFSSVLKMKVPNA